jgi:hypothetical protein
VVLTRHLAEALIIRHCRYPPLLQIPSRFLFAFESFE